MAPGHKDTPLLMIPANIHLSVPPYTYGACQNDVVQYSPNSLFHHAGTPMPYVARGMTRNHVYRYADSFVQLWFGLLPCSQLAVASTNSRSRIVKS